MASAARFPVDPRLAALLGEGYRSAEHALKELIDNAWDADAASVDIRLPDVVSGDPIVVIDDGTGMTEAEIRRDYLAIARSRQSRKGDQTIERHRTVTGRKGIGDTRSVLRARIHLEDGPRVQKCENLTGSFAKRAVILGQEGIQGREREVTIGPNTPSTWGVSYTHCSNASNGTSPECAASIVGQQLRLTVPLQSGMHRDHLLRPAHCREPGIGRSSSQRFGPASQQMTKRCQPRYSQQQRKRATDSDRMAFRAGRQ